MTRQAYPTDLSDAEWQIIALLIPPTKPGGWSRTTDMRAVVNANFYFIFVANRLCLAYVAA
ncbi:MAG: hypothetical protein C0184_09360 [Chloroflexus aggregans]|uniref:Transposase n=1 Tax=Chloroflexus aggregans TaxID=152260 RepID=A0A2J6X3N3_9CHLR|nr:MAG: hypothetical protein C0184_09360 [Chloroflexus aggregans]